MMTRSAFVFKTVLGVNGEGGDGERREKKEVGFLYVF